MDTETPEPQFEIGDEVRIQSPDGFGWIYALRSWGWECIHGPL